MSTEESQKKRIHKKFMRFKSLCAVLIGEREGGMQALYGRVNNFKKD